MAKRDLTRQCLVPPGSSPGKNTEEVGLGHPWAEERWGQNLRARGREGQCQWSVQAKDKCRRGSAMFLEDTRDWQLATRPVGAKDWGQDKTAGTQMAP